jgi:hypothetical protein
MGLNFDLAALAGMAGLGGSAVAATGAFIFFKGIIMRVIVQLIVTAALSFVGFIALFNVLGFTIVPKASTAMATPQAADSFSPASAPAEATVTYEIKSPWSK